MDLPLCPFNDPKTEFKLEFFYAASIALNCSSRFDVTQQGLLINQPIGSCFVLCCIANVEIILRFLRTSYVVLSYQHPSFGFANVGISQTLSGGSLLNRYSGGWREELLIGWRVWRGSFCSDTPAFTGGDSLRCINNSVLDRTWKALSRHLHFTPEGHSQPFGCFQHRKTDIPAHGRSSTTTSEQIHRAEEVCKELETTVGETPT